MAQQDGQQIVDVYGPYGLGMPDIDVFTPEEIAKCLEAEYDDSVAKGNGSNVAGSSMKWSFKLDVGERITKVTINHGHIVDGIRFQISDVRGTTRTEGLSGAGGSVSEITLNPDEYITHLSGYCGNYLPGRGFYIASLLIYTNLRPNEGYGPYGEGEGIVAADVFRVPAPLNGPIIGFFGSQGRFLESLGIYVGLQMVDKYGPYGSQSSKDWSFQLIEGQRITKVMIRHGYIVDGIGFQISNANGRTTTNWFGSRGGRLSEITLETFEFITQISGTHGNYIHNQGQLQIASLKIHTNIFPQGYGPYGLGRDVQGSVPFSTPVQLGGPVTGFFGRRGAYLDSIGIHVTPHKLIDLNRTHGSRTSPNWSIELAAGVRIEKVMIRHGYIVDGIGFQVFNGDKTITKWFSGAGGTLSEITLDRGEIITQISGTHGDYQHGGHCIASLRIHTNLRPDGYGPYGQAKLVNNLKPFRTPVPIDSGAIIGFSGAYRDHLDSIGTKIQPAGEIIVQQGPYGSDGSSNWNFKFEKGRRVQRIMIRHSIFVHGIGITMASRLLLGRGPDKSITQWFTKRLGTLSTIDLLSDEYITQISGMYASLLIGAPAIASLRIHTNFKPEGYGPFGGGDQPLLQLGLTNRTTFSTPVPLGGPVAGFLGSTRGDFLHSIGLYARVYSDSNNDVGRTEN